MKSLLVILIITFAINGISQEDSAIINNPNKYHISEIVNTLTECNCVVMEMNGKLTEKEKKLASSGESILFDRNFSELDSLFENSSEIVQLYAFGGICLTYPDSLNEKHLQILKKERAVNIYQQGKDTFPTKSTSELAEMMYKVAKQTIEENKQQLIIQNMISDFILKYSTDPKTYENISFVNYHVYSTLDGTTFEKIKASEVYSVKHIFKIRNNNGIINEYQVRFKIGSELDIMLIEEEKDIESNTVNCNPPNLNWWFENLGRKITEAEKKELGLKN